MGDGETGASKFTWYQGRSKGLLICEWVVKAGAEPLKTIDAGQPLG